MDTIKATYFNLKNKVDAAYNVFRRKPTHANNVRYSEAAQAFKEFCLQTMAELVGDTEDAVNKNTILENIDLYKTCKHCGSTLLYTAGTNDYLASSDFLENFPGWCHTCLVEHCLATNCESCTVASDPATCSFKVTKEIYTQDAE